MQKAGKYSVVKRLKRRESRIVRDLNHKISRKIVNTAKEEGSGIKLEKLKGIRKMASLRRAFRYSLHSWSFYQLQDMIEYKARLLGIDQFVVDRDVTKGSTDTPRAAMVGDATNHRTPYALAWGVCQ